ncbi:MAG: sensor histidine kinase [Pseudobdellovibrionaceae bacterium]
MSIADNAEAAQQQQSGSKTTEPVENLNLNQDIYSHPRYFRIAAVLLFSLYVPWGYACIYLFQANEIILARALTSLIAITPGLWSFFKSYNPKWAENIYSAFIVISTIQMIYLAAINQFHIVYVTATFTMYLGYILINSLRTYITGCLVCLASIPLIAYLHNVPSAQWISMFLQLNTYFLGLGLFIFIKRKLSLELVGTLVKLNESEKSRAESSKMAALGTMAGGVAHEINNPISIIQGKAGIIRRWSEQNKFDSEKFVQAMDKITETVERIGKITKGLLIFSRNGDADPFVSTNIHTLVQNTLELVHEKFKDAKIDLKMDDFQESLKTLHIDCKETQITQLIYNLLTNAFDAVKPLEDKWVKVSLQSETDQVKILVTDSGLGIADKVAEKMMTPFYSTKEVGQGQGLGLSISKGIADSHKGSLVYNNSTGHTQFVLTLPRLQSQNELPLSSAQAA